MKINEFSGDPWGSHGEKRGLGKASRVLLGLRVRFVTRNPGIVEEYSTFILNLRHPKTQKKHEEKNTLC